MDWNGLETNASRDEDDFQLLHSFPAESIDLVYLGYPFFGSRIQEDSRTERAEARSPEDRWQGGGQADLDWIAAPLDDLHRILKPSGALFLVCDEAVGLYVRVLLEELFNRRNAGNLMLRWKADSGPAHHYVFYYRKSGDIAGRNGHLYSIIHCEGKDDPSLVAFSFVQGRPGRRFS